jgi:uncharacterized protein YdgA (DUF945 family)
MNRNVLAAAAAVVLLGVAVVGGAAVTGVQAKKKLQAQPAEWQAQWPLLKVSAQKYEYGLFSSTNTMMLQLGCKTANPVSGITIRQRIKHGPLPGFSSFGAAVIDTEVVVPEAERKQFVELIGDKSPFTAHTVVGFGGSMNTQFSIPAINYKSAKGDQINWQGLTGEVRQSGASLRYEVATPGFSALGKDDKMSFDMRLSALRMRGEMNGTEGSFWMWPGTGDLDLAFFEMYATAAPERGMPPVKMTLNQLKASSENKRDKDLLSNSTKFSASGVINDVRVDKFELLSSVKRLHAPTYQRLIQRFMDTSAAACEMKQAVSPQVMLAQVQQDFGALLPFDPQYSVDKLAVEIDGKRAELSYSVGINGVTPADAQMPLQALAMTKAQLKGQVKLPVAWMEKAVARFGNGPNTPQSDPATQAEMVSLMLAKFTNDGLIVREGDMISSQVSFDRGQLLVNGKPVNRAPQ